MATLITNMTYLRAQIKENVLFMYPSLGEPNISVATHDNLFWVIVEHNDNGWRWQSSKGFKSDEAALHDMLKFFSTQVWEKAKERNITLSK